MEIKEYKGLPEGAVGIRQDVFVTEQGFTDEFDETDAVATHLLALDGDRPVGTCRVFPKGKGGAFMLGRLAVRKEYRGKGLGAALIAAAEEAVKKQGGKTVCLHAQEKAQGFYLAVGYTPFGKADEEQGCPHVWMMKSISTSPFRELIRKNKKLSEEECTRVLVKENRGVLSVNGQGGYPYGSPMNYFYDPEEGCVYFHCGRRGHRVDALKQDKKVSFCVTEQGVKKDGDWAYTVRSVIIFGEIEIIDDYSEVVRVCEKLCYKFTDDRAFIEEEIERSAKATILLKLMPKHLCGKIVEEK